jgi:magnesium and cobalt exporter, CNNM family
MINLSLQIAIIVALTLLNGLFAMSETALVSSRKARLKQRIEAGDRNRVDKVLMKEEVRE